MFHDERKQMDIELDKAIQDGRITSSRRLFSFGAGDYTQGIQHRLTLCGFSLTGILDNDEKKIGTFCSGVQVMPINELSKKDRENGFFIVCSHFHKEMCEQLQGEGIPNNHILEILLDSYEDSLTKNIEAFFRGKKVYQRIRQQYPEHEILLCPYTGTGDIYLIGTFLNQFLKKEKIENYVLVVVNGACQKVSNIFDIHNVWQIDGIEECRELCRYYMIHSDQCQIRVLNDSWFYTDPVQWLRGLHGMNFASMFRRFVFDMADDILPEHPKFRNCSEEIEKIVQAYGIKKGKTIILAPYATTLENLPRQFWEKLAGKLTRMGYYVCTNVGNAEEMAVSGTKGIFFSLDIAPQITEWAGGFIGVRSGLCDVISGTNAKKVILYGKDNFFFNCTAYEYFSLRGNGLSKDAVEIEFCNDWAQNLVETVLLEFK